MSLLARGSKGNWELPLEPLANNASMFNTAKRTASMNMGAEHEKVQQKERIHENPDKKIKNLKKRE
jgi:hypothetical protein